RPGGGARPRGAEADQLPRRHRLVVRGPPRRRRVPRPEARQDLRPDGRAADPHHRAVREAAVRADGVLRGARPALTRPIAATVTGHGMRPVAVAFFFRPKGYVPRPFRAPRARHWAVAGRVSDRLSARRSTACSRGTRP